MILNSAFPYFLRDLCEIRHRKATHITADYLRVLQKSVQNTLNFVCGRKWSYIYAFTVKVWGFESKEPLGEICEIRHGATLLIIAFLNRINRYIAQIDRAGVLSTVGTDIFCIIYMILNL
jgi:hypothetical protein